MCASRQDRNIFADKNDSSLEHKRSKYRNNLLCRKGSKKGWKINLQYGNCGSTNIRIRPWDRKHLVVATWLPPLFQFWDFATWQWPIRRVPEMVLQVLALVKNFAPCTHQLWEMKILQQNLHYYVPPQYPIWYKRCQSMNLICVIINATYCEDIIQ